MNKTKKISYVAILSALAIVINLFESMFIPPIQFGIRFGLANIISLVTIHLFSYKELIFVNVMWVSIGSLLRGMIFGSQFWISFMGVLFSTLVIMVCHRLKTSLIFMSIMSAIFHSLGQVVVVMMLYSQAMIASIFPILAISSIATGILTGFVAKECLRRVKV